MKLLLIVLCAGMLCGCESNTPSITVIPGVQIEKIQVVKVDPRKFKVGDCVQLHPAQKEAWEKFCVQKIFGIGSKAYHVLDGGCALIQDSLFFFEEESHEKIKCPHDIDWSSP